MSRETGIMSLSASGNRRLWHVPGVLASTSPIRPAAMATSLRPRSHTLPQPGGAGISVRAEHAEMSVWVILVDLTMFESLLLFPRERLYSGLRDTLHLCQQRKHSRAPPSLARERLAEPDGWGR